MIDISIIVPVYNVEKYLRQCLDSCLHQALPTDQFEIIVVNDGSPDNSITIIREYEQKYSNVVLVDKPNGGLSSARNAGLDVAKGDYIWFVDSDDWIEYSINDIVDSINQQPGADVYCFDTHTVSEDGEYLERISRNLIANDSYTGLQLFQSFIFPYSAVQFNVWKKSFLDNNGLRFKVGALYDDWQFILRAYAVMNRCNYIKIAAYYYRLRQNTISTSKKTFRNLYDCVETACDYVTFAAEKKLEGDNAKMMRLGVCCMLNDAYRLSLKDATKVERKEYLDYFFSKNIWIPALKRVGTIKNWIAYISMLTYYKLKI